ncbi:predicted protein [Postia placenta Mad-698-R]|uniref:Uncharacterized protein n=1 Tax=Postia placenta MAD-698-R-SB12 TaxID=670580 RepID=A0A1X6MWF2_9APHY|nr:hypothetical protein POSPLADRAFT_1048082 [Postia placenta MAD-698-R-SB12]EED80512.1 predicted protein [Postia placenta Mad-698-R]OSX60705.1 hypothetical protein POSPLADRAFT_1048082 [Postia placenta MAD-698-R-SB12]
MQQGQFSHPAGTAGVAYAGGAASSNIGSHLRETVQTTAKDPAVERVRASDRASPKEDSSSSQSAKRPMREKDAQNIRESPRTRDRSQTVSSISSLDGHSSQRTPEYRGSPQYQTPLASPGERSATYPQYAPEGYQVQATATQGPTPPTRKPVPAIDATASRVTPPASSKLAASSHTPPLQAMAARPPDRSLPVQEEPEEDVGHYIEHEPEYEDRHRDSPTPSDAYPDAHGSRYDARHEQARGLRHPEDDEETLNEEVDEQRKQAKSSEDSESGSGFTPRSPSVNLPERPAQYASANGQYAQAGATLRRPPRSTRRLCESSIVRARPTNWA